MSSRLTPLILGLALSACAPHRGAPEARPDPCDLECRLDEAAAAKLGWDGQPVVGEQALPAPDDSSTDQRIDEAPSLAQVVHVSLRAGQLRELLGPTGVRYANVGQPSPWRPLVYNPTILTREYTRALRDLPPALVGLLRSRRALSDAAELVPESKLSTVLDASERLQLVYASASRWVAKYPNRLDAAYAKSLDLRPALELREREPSLRRDFAKWGSLSADERLRRVTPLERACTLWDGSAACAQRRIDLAAQSDPGHVATEWLDETLARLRARLKQAYSIELPHPAARITRASDLSRIAFTWSGLDAQGLGWVSDVIQDAWQNAGASSGAYGFAFGQASGSEESLQLQWLPGRTPQVDAVRGHVITLDAAAGRESTQARQMLAHEFGHILGFLDCYVEFWDPGQEAFVFYPLDESNRMCAVSGTTLPIHVDEITRAYGIRSDSP